MGVYSTMEITRADAVNVLKEALESDAVTNEELEDMLFGLFGERTLHNFLISETPEGWVYRPGQLRVD